MVTVLAPIGIVPWFLHNPKNISTVIKRKLSKVPTVKIPLTGPLILNNHISTPPTSRRCSDSLAQDKLLRPSRLLGYDRNSFGSLFDDGRSQSGRGL
jgi:hypothetical protein